MNLALGNRRQYHPRLYGFPIVNHYFCAFGDGVENFVGDQCDAGFGDFHPAGLHCDVVANFRLAAAGELQQFAVQIGQRVGGGFAELFDVQVVLQLLGFDRFLADGVVDRDDDVLGEIQHALQVAGGEVEEQAEAAGVGFAEPDVGDGGGEGDVAHPLAADFGAGDFDAAAVADHAAVADALVLAAEAFPVFGGAEQPLAKQPVFFGAEGAVVDGFGLGDFAVGPAFDLLRRSDGYADGVEVGGYRFRPVGH